MNIIESKFSNPYVCNYSGISSVRPATSMDTKRHLAGQYLIW